MNGRTFYEVLQVSQNAEPEIIQAAYQSLIRRYSTANAQGTPETENLLKIINRAYEVLSDPVKREGYDAALLTTNENQPGTNYAGKKTTVIPEPESLQESGDSMADLYAAAVGEKNTSYYLEKFEEFDRKGPGFKGSWNWPAFLFTGFWALYRKMYGWFFVCWGLFTVGNLSEKAGNPYVWFAVLAAQVAFGIYANSLYHGQIRKKIAGARLAFRDEHRQKTHLSNKGGINTWILWATIGLITVGILTAIAIPALNDSKQGDSGQNSQESMAFDPSTARPTEDSAAHQSQQPLPHQNPDPLGLFDSPSAQNQQPSPPRDLFAEKVANLTTRAEEGDINAQVELGIIYVDGKITTQNYDQAQFWFRKAAEQGNAIAQGFLGALYYEGLGVKQDYLKARHWYQNAADKGIPFAQLNLGILYAKGQGVPQNYSQAALWFHKAAEQGESDAQSYLGDMYYQGHGVQQDYYKARYWLTKAAEQGNTSAIENLTYMDRQRLGIR